jgi:hypothetical protein
VAGQWFCTYTGAPVSSTNETDRHDIAEILLKVALNTINHILSVYGELPYPEIDGTFLINIHHI